MNSATVNTTKTQETPVIAISVSDSPDLPSLGMGERHIHRAMNSLATYLLSYGYRLAYGGDLRHGGFTEELFEIASRYDRLNGKEPNPPVTDYLAWPVWTSVSSSDLRDLGERLKYVGKVVCLSSDGFELSSLDYPSPTKEPTKSQAADALTAMRMKMLCDTDARIVLGGRIEGYLGSMPGVAEEALISLQHRKPLYVLGGFGGCARDIAATMQLADPVAGTSTRFWSGRDNFIPFSGDVCALNNGLNQDENSTLAETPYIHRAIELVLRGLRRLAQVT